MLRITAAPIEKHRVTFKEHFNGKGFPQNQFGLSAVK